jgi:hypothetical protein
MSCLFVYIRLAITTISESIRSYSSIEVIELKLSSISELNMESADL